MSRTQATPNGGSVTLRPVTAQDERLLWEWRNDAVVRKGSFSTDPIPCEQHRRWFRQKLAAPDCRIWIAERHGRPVGHIRYDRSGDAAELSYSVAAAHRGRGWGTALLRASVPRACRELGLSRVFGYARRTNQASIRTFRRAGFHEVRAMVRQGAACLEFEWRP